VTGRAGARSWRVTRRKVTHHGRLLARAVVNQDYGAEITVSEELPRDPRSEAQRKGVVIGILVAVLLLLVLYFFWRGTGVRDAEGNHPPKPAPSAIP
jgi:hypothetical protein